MEINEVIILLISFLLWLSGFWFLFSITLCRKEEINKNYPKISIIIPARNEEKNISVLLDSINSQDYIVDEVIVVNDSSTDRTEELSISKGAIVINSEQLPNGWLGKPWVCYQGAKFATGEIFIFLDADTKIEKGGLRKMVDTFVTNYEKNRIVMSISPFHRVKKFYEEFSLMFNIIMTGSMGAFTPIKNRSARGLFGPSLIVHREDYFQVGGHELVKDKILENVFMAEKFLKSGLKLKCYGGAGSVSFRMYPDGFKSLINGWTKAFASGAGKTATVDLLNIIFWISGGFTIFISLIYHIVAFSNIPLWTILYLLYAIQFYCMAKRIGNFKLITCLIFPMQLVFYCVVFSRSLYYQITKKKIHWKSREVKS